MYQRKFPMEKKYEKKVLNAFVYRSVFRTGKKCYPQVFLSTLSKKKRCLKVLLTTQNYIEKLCFFEKTVYMKNR